MWYRDYRNRDFAPTSIPNLTLWLDAADEATVTLDVSSQVSQWDDKSGNGLHAIQGTASRRPRYLVSESPNIHKVIDFAVFGLELTATISGTGIVTPRTMFLVFKFDAGGGTFMNVVWNSNLQYYVESDLRLNTNAGAGGTLQEAVFADTWYIATSLANSSNSYIKINDTKLTGTMGSNTATGSLRFSTYDAFSFKGTIAEFILYDRALSDIEAEAVESYLSYKWSISI